MDPRSDNNLLQGGSRRPQLTSPAVQLADGRQVPLRRVTALGIGERLRLSARHYVSQGGVRMRELAAGFVATADSFWND